MNCEQHSDGEEVLGEIHFEEAKMPVAKIGGQSKEVLGLESEESGDDCEELAGSLRQDRRLGTSIGFLTYVAVLPTPFRLLLICKRREKHFARSAEFVESSLLEICAVNK